MYTETKMRSLLVISTLGILTAISSISIDLYLPAFEIMAKHFSVSIIHMENSITIFILGMALGQLFTGPASDIWGRQIPLRLSIIIYGLCSLACMMTHSFSAFLILRLLQGLAGSTCQAVSRALVSDIYIDKNAAHIFTVLQIIMGVSPILSPMIGGILSEISRWEYLFLIMSLISAIALIGCITILPTGKLPTKDRISSLKKVLIDYRICIRHPSFINYAIVRAISNSAAFSLVTASPFIFMQLYKVTKVQFGFVFSGLTVGVIVAGIINTRLIKHFQIFQIVRFATISQICSGFLMTIAIYLHMPFSLFWGFIFLFVSMLGLILPNVTSLYIGNFPASSGSASALIGAVSYLAAFLITTLLRFLNNGSPYPMVVIMVCCAILANLCLHYKKGGIVEQ